MPPYENTQPPYSVGPGEFAQPIVTPADGTGTLGAGNFSERVAIADVYGGVMRPIVIQFSYASAPASVQYDIYGAQDDTGTSSYAKIGTTNNTAGDQVNIARDESGGYSFRFICVKEVISPAVLTTIKVRQ